MLFAYIKFRAHPPYSCAKRSRLEREGCSRAGRTTNTRSGGRHHPDASVQFKLPCSQVRFRPAHARLIEDYIEQNISRNITLEELANICNCTPIQFARKFYMHYGMRPHAMS
jgi:AraC-like DNA-binding protein